MGPVTSDDSESVAITTGRYHGVPVTARCDATLRPVLGYLSC